MKDVLLLVGAGQLGMAITRRIGFNHKILSGDKNFDQAIAIADTLEGAGFDVVATEIDIADKTSILSFIKKGQSYGEISLFINAAGVSPSQASIETVLKIDLYGTAVLLEEIGKVIKVGGAGVTISSQSGYRMPALTTEEDRLLAMTPVDQLLDLDILNPTNIDDSLHAYQLAKRGNGKRVMAEAVK